MGILTGDIAKKIFQGFKGKLLTGILRHAEPQGALNSYGDSTSQTTTDYDIEGFVDQYTAFFKSQAGIPDTDLKINIFAQSIPGVTPTKDDKAQFLGVWYQIRRVSVDPATALFECQAFKINSPFSGSGSGQSS